MKILECWGIHLQNPIGLRRLGALLPDFELLFTVIVWVTNFQRMKFLKCRSEALQPC